MSKRDPFPMSSDAARRLELSVGSDEATNWNSMNTSTAVAGPSAGAMAVDGAGEGLVNPYKKKMISGADISAQADMEDEENKADSFLDTPLSDTRSTGMERVMISNLRFLERIYHNLYGDSLPMSEMVRTLSMAATLFFMIGGYWLLRSLKDPVLIALCGVEAIPRAKMLSVFVVLGVVTVYNKLLDADAPRHRLFYVFGTFYFLVFTTIALLLKHETIGLPNEKFSQTRLLGWISYCSIESFGSVMVSLFWSFANSNFSLETAKASYGVMVAAAQVGSIIGPTVVNQYSKAWGPANCYLVGALCMILLQGTMTLYIRTYGTSDSNSGGSSKKKKDRAGVLEGVFLFYKYNYVKGIFAISCLFMVEVTIVDFTMKRLAKDFFAAEFPCEVGMSCYETESGVPGMSQDATEALTAFMGFFGQATNTLSFLLSLLGTSAVLRTLGLRLTLLLFPSLCLVVIIFVRLYPSLYVVFGAMMMLKANSYALNNPTKEILYQPTSSAVKYKAKSWIDIFGARGSKALGSVVTNAFSDSAASLIANGSLVGMAVASFLIWNANFMGKKFDEYTASGYVVGDTNETTYVEGDDIQMASAQNDNPDTSCAIEDDDELGPDEEGQGDDDVVDDDHDEEDRKPAPTLTRV